MRYFGLLSDDGVVEGVFRERIEDDGYWLEYLDLAGEWQDDPELARYLWGGDAGATEIRLEEVLNYRPNADIKEEGEKINAIDEDLLTTEALRYLSTYTSEWYEGLEATTRKQLRSVLEGAVRDDLDYNTVASQLEPIFGRRRAALISQTEMTRLFDKGGHMVFNAADVKQSAFRTVKDAFVCRDCYSKHGMIFETDQRPDLPLHPGCRCFYAPVEEPLPAITPKTIPDAPTFTSAIDAAMWMSDYWPSLRVNFRAANDMPLEALNPVVQQWTRLAREWPDVAADVKFFGFPESVAMDPFWGEYATAYGLANRTTGVMLLNPDYWMNPVEFQQLLKRDVITHFHPIGCDTFESVVTHEFGHFVQYRFEAYGAEMKAFLPVVRYSDNFGLYYFINEYWTQVYRLQTPYLQKVSDYAIKNEREAWAELFTYAYHGAANPLVERGATIPARFPAQLDDIVAVKFIKSMRDVINARYPVPPYLEAEYELIDVAATTLTAEELTAARNLWDEWERLLGLR